jgi:sigma-B regulation protein RsbU (phosphoserine phosphatase)
MVSGLLRTLAPRRRGPAILLRSLNDALLERRVDAQYVTLLVMLWEPRERKFTIANAGNTTPIVCRGAKTHTLRAEGVPLGLLEDRDYEANSETMLPGDVVVLFSDGLADQHNSAGEEYGHGRLARILRSVCENPPRDIVKAILADLDAFQGNKAQFDDQTLIVIKVN